MGSFMSCVFICGAVQVVQVVHSDGHVERLIRPVEQGKRLTTSLNSSSYLLLPIQQAGGPGNDESYKYRRLTSLRFYKSALPSSSPSRQQAPEDRDKDGGGVSFEKAASKPKRKQQHLRQEWTQLLLDSSLSSSSPSSSSSSSSLSQQQPFKVKREDGVTKLVVSKKYLAHLLSQQQQQRSKQLSTDHPTTSMAEQPVAVTKHQQCSSRVENKRASVWRPALESISEAQLHDR